MQNRSMATLNSIYNMRLQLNYKLASTCLDIEAFSCLSTHINHGGLVFVQALKTNASQK